MLYGNYGGKEGYGKGEAPDGKGTGKGYGKEKYQTKGKSSAKGGGKGKPQGKGGIANSSWVCQTCGDYTYVQRSITACHGCGKPPPSSEQQWLLEVSKQQRERKQSRQNANSGEESATKSGEWRTTPKDRRGQGKARKLATRRSEEGAAAEAEEAREEAENEEMEEEEQPPQQAVGRGAKQSKAQELMGQVKEWKAKHQRLEEIVKGDSDLAESLQKPMEELRENINKASVQLQKAKAPTQLTYFARTKVWRREAAMRKAKERVGEVQSEMEEVQKKLEKEKKAFEEAEKAVQKAVQYEGECREKAGYTRQPTLEEDLELIMEWPTEAESVCEVPPEVRKAKRVVRQVEAAHQRTGLRRKRR